MMEERFSSHPELSRRRLLTIPRKPVGSHHVAVSPNPYIPQRRPSVEASISIQYEPYRSPVEEPPATFKYLPYRSPTEVVPAPLQYVPYRSPTEVQTTPLHLSAYRRPSAARSSVSRGMSMSSYHRNSRGSMSNEAISPISPISGQSSFR